MVVRLDESATSHIVRAGSMPVGILARATLPFRVTAGASNYTVCAMVPHGRFSARVHSYATILFSVFF